MTAAASGPRLAGARLRSPALVIGALIIALVAAAAIAATVGAAWIPLRRLPAALGLVQGDDAALTARDQLVLWSMRMPRIVLGVMVGALLGPAAPCAGPVPQSARRSHARRRVAGRRRRRRAADRGRRPHASASRCAFEALAGRSHRRCARYHASSSIASLRAGGTDDRALLLAGIAVGALVGAGNRICSRFSPPTRSCATSRSGCSARSAAPPGQARGDRAARRAGCRLRSSRAGST